MKRTLTIALLFTSFLLVSCNNTKTPSKQVSTGSVSSGTTSKEIDETMNEIDKIINEISTGSTK